MKNAIQKMQARKGDKNGSEKDEGKVRTTISIRSDLCPKSAKVAARIRERRSANYSHFIETLIAEDTGLIPKLQEAAA